MPANSKLNFADMPGQPDYGLGGDARVTGIPKVVGPAPGPCPNCGCVTLNLITVEVEVKQLRGGKGTGHYASCAACPWASPMLSVAADLMGGASDASK